jgi:hypothetical protein
MSAIIKMIWALLGPVLVDLALKVGLPEAMKWLTSKGLPKFVIDGISAFLKAVIDGLTGVKQVASEASDEIRSIKASDMSAADKRFAIKTVTKRAKEEARRRCTGVACPSDTKGL